MKFRRLGSLLLVGAMLFACVPTSLAAESGESPEVVATEESAADFLADADRQVNSLPAKVETFDEIRSTSANADGKLYLMSDGVPEDAIAYAKENVDNFYLSSAVVGYATSDISKFQLGAPFKLQRADAVPLENDMYYFPIVSGNEIKAMLIVTKNDDNQYCYTFSLELVDALNDLRQVTTKENPFYIFGLDKGFVAANSDGTEVYVLEVFNFVEEDHTVAANEIRSVVAEELEDDRSVHAGGFVVEVSSSTAISDGFDDRTTQAWMGKRIGLPGVTQDGYNHCWAASSASLCRYYRGSSTYPSRVQVVTYIKGGNYNVGGSVTDVRNAINYFTSRTASTVGSPLNFTDVQYNILRSRPFYIATETKSGTRYGHGMAFDGYYRNDSYSGNYPPVRYFVMEPNRGYVVELSSTMGASSAYGSSTYIVLNGLKFYWYNTVTVS